MKYATIDRAYEVVTEVCKSKFICKLVPIESLEEGLQFVQKIKKEYSDARHNCYAIIGTPESNEMKYSDDGEPSGTAGQPMMTALQKNGLYGVACVVTRYFGGIKLGAGRLAQTYLKSVVDTIGVAEIIDKKLSSVFVIELEYGEYKLFNNSFSAIEHIVLDTEYGSNVRITLATPVENEAKVTEKITELTQGKAPLKETQKYITYKR